MLMLIAWAPATAQKYFSRTGHISFFSHAPLEDIEAHNYQANTILDATTGEMVFSVLIKSFQFEKALMQEHFNEKYLESDKYPKASFKGKVTNMSEIDLEQAGSYPAQVAGTLTIHGETHEVEVEGTLEVSGEGVKAKAEFPVTVADYNIKIPGVVRDNIAKVVAVKVDLTYSPYNP